MAWLRHSDDRSPTHIWPDDVIEHDIDTLHCVCGPIIHDWVHADGTIRVTVTHQALDPYC